MAEAATNPNSYPEVDPELADERVLVDVDHLVSGLQSDGSVAQETLADVKPNYETATYEISFPLGVTTTLQRVEHYVDDVGRRRRMIMWMGRSIVDSTLNSHKFYKYEQGHTRGYVETNEARHAGQSIRPRIAQAMISPKMTRYDGPAHVAEAEHVHIDDSLRVAYPITNNKDEVIARKLQSLLVRNIPLEAWVAMLRDPGNIFGRSFDIENEQSALSVMKLFSQLELPEELVPEGPVTLVAAVQQYIKDGDTYDSVGRQLEGFRRDQELYKTQAELTARQWLQFDIELARSLKDGIANNAVQAFIVSLQDQWDSTMLEELTNSHMGDNQYIITRKLAAMLERAKRKVLCDEAAIAVGNETIIAQLAPVHAAQLQDRIRSLQIMHVNHMLTDQEYAREQAEIHRDIASANLKDGDGGCPGDTSANFRSPDATTLSASSSTKDQRSDWEKGKRKWKIGKCQVKLCPSPKPTEVGPCSVCKRCQAVFDRGGDPTKSVPITNTKKADKAHTVKAQTKNEAQAEAEIAKQVDETFAELDVAAIEAAEKQRMPQQMGQLALSK